MDLERQLRFLPLLRIRRIHRLIFNGLEYDKSWGLLDETNKLASDTAAFPFAVNMDGVSPLTDAATLPSTLALFSMDGEDAGDEILHLEDEVL